MRLGWSRVNNAIYLGPIIRLSRTLVAHLARLISPPPEKRQSSDKPSLARPYSLPFSFSSHHFASFCPCNKTMRYLFILAAITLLPRGLGSREEKRTSGPDDGESGYEEERELSWTSQPLAQEIRDTGK